MEFEDLIVRQEDDVLWVTMNRPDRLNALNRRMTKELRDLFDDLYWRRDVRVVVLQGAGRAFCAGMDIKERGPGILDVASNLDRQRGFSDIVMKMRRCPQPILALVNGAASGGGMGLALASDIRIATPTARMNAAFIRIGVSACDVGVSYFLPRMIGASAASAYMLTGRFIDAKRGFDLGLFAEVVDEDKLEEAGRAWLKDMLNAAPLALRMTKDALNFAVDAMGLDAAIAMEDRNQVICARDVNAREGMMAFTEKRAPTYSKSPFDRGDNIEIPPEDATGV